MEEVGGGGGVEMRSAKYEGRRCCSITSLALKPLYHNL